MRQKASDRVSGSFAGAPPDASFLFVQEYLTEILSPVDYVVPVASGKLQKVHIQMVVARIRKERSGVAHKGGSIRRVPVVGTVIEGTNQHLVANQILQDQSLWARLDGHALRYDRRLLLVKKIRDRP